MYSIKNSAIGEAQHTGTPKKIFNFGTFTKIKDLLDCPISLRFWLFYISFDVTFWFSVDKTFDVAYII